MVDHYIKRLKSCAHADEVWALMQGRTYPNSDGSAFCDEQLWIKAGVIKFAPVTPPSGMMGLAYRMVLYLMLDGQIGNVPINSGNSNKALSLALVLRELSVHGKFDTQLQITGKMLDNYIKAQRKVGNTEGTIYLKLHLLQMWLKHNHLLPYFLRLSYDLFVSSEQWDSLVLGMQKEEKDYKKGIGGSKEPYPLDQLAVIVTEAIDYIDAYSEDCLLAAQFYKDTKTKNLSNSASTHDLTNILRTTDHRFTEPQLAMTQQYALSLKSNRWMRDPNIKRKGPLVVCSFVVHQLQAACVIVILMLTAMRKGELETMMRYPEAKKTSHYELDGSLELERLIYKTAETDKGELVPIAVPPIVIKALYLLSRISEISDGKHEGIINLMSINYGIQENSQGRILYLIHDFCDSLESVPPSPHQFRHAMAFLVAFLNDDIGIELAMALLGHKSIEMTKKYMGHYKQVILKTFGTMFDENKRMQEAMEELQAEQSSKGLEKIIQAVENKEPMVGPILKRLFQGFEFAGSITDEGAIFFAKSQRLLLERGMLAVVEHPTHFCVRDLTDPTQMPCQIGLNLEDFTNAPVISAQCQTSCGCRLYIEPQVEEMRRLSEEMDEAYPDDIRELLKGNRYYIANSFEQTYANVIEEFDLIKQSKGE